MSSRDTTLHLLQDITRRESQIFRGYLAEDYDGIGQFVLTALSKGSSNIVKARVAAGDFGTGKPLPVGTPIVVRVYHGKPEILSLGGLLTEVIPEELPPEPGPGEVGNHYVKVNRWKLNGGGNTRQQWLKGSGYTVDQTDPYWNDANSYFQVPPGLQGFYYVECNPAVHQTVGITVIWDEWIEVNGDNLWFGRNTSTEPFVRYFFHNYPNAYLRVGDIVKFFHAFPQGPGSGSGGGDTDYFRMVLTG